MEALELFKGPFDTADLISDSNVMSNLTVNDAIR